MKSRALLILSVLAAALVPHSAAQGARAKGVTKICPGYTDPIPYKKPCPPPPDSPPPPAPSPVPVVTVNDATVVESAGNAYVVLCKTGSSATATTFNYATSNGTATAGSDYTATSGSYLIPSGGNQCHGFNIPIINDTVDEGNETITVTLSSVVNGTLGDATATITITDDDDAEAPTVPDPVTGNELAESLEGYTGRTVSDHNYTLDIELSSDPTPDAGIDPLGAFRLICGQGVKGYNDHVVYPGQAGRSHYHSFNGNNTVNANSTFASLLATGTSTCQSGNPTASQRSVYWFPDMLLSGGLTALNMNYNSVYYKRLPASSRDCGTPTGTGFGPVGICTEIPNGLKMVTGSKMVANQYGPANYRTDVPPVHFQCVSGGSGDYKNLAQLKAGAPSCSQVAQIAEFPECWDGIYLWKTDRSHVVYKVNYNTDGKLRCPPTHPYLITQLTIHDYFSVAPGELAGLYLASDYMDPTQPAGWSLHADAHIVWDARVKKMFHDNCINRHLNCSGGLLGNGYRLKGAQQPTYGFTNPNRTSVVPPMPENMVMP